MFSILCGVLIVSGCSDLVENELDQFLCEAYEVWQFHGVALVARNGQVVLRKGYGLSNIEENRANTAATKFLIGSITKQFTSAAILHLEQRGLLDINDPISKYIDDFPAETADRITIHHLLSHTSGIPSLNNDMMEMLKRGDAVTPSELITTFKELPLEFEPGGKYNYSNSGYVLLGKIIERVSGKTYGDYLQEYIFDPVGMKQTGIFNDYSTLTDFAVGYQKIPDGSLVRANIIHPSIGYSAGAVASTVGDMFLWSRALYTEDILSSESIEKMLTPNLGNYGYGWIIRDIRGHKVTAHAGGTPGFSTWMERWIDDSIFIAVFCNNANTPDGAIAAGLASIMLGEPYNHPVVKTPVKIDPEALDDYIGVFEIEEGIYRNITRSGNSLFAQRTGMPPLVIVPEGDGQFYFEHDPTVTLEFIRDGDGTVVEQVIHYWVAEDTARRIDSLDTETIP